MTVRTKGEQKAYLDGFEMCADCITKYLTNEGKQKLECLLTAVRNAIEIEDIEPQERSDEEMTKAELMNLVGRKVHIYISKMEKETYTEHLDM